MHKELIGAMVTPFNNHDEIDYDEVKKLLDIYNSDGHDAIVVAGTTGEESSLSLKEKIELVNFALNNTNLKIIVGVVENNTKKAIEQIELLNSLPIYAVLVALPYYNKPPQRGIFLHFKKLLQASKHPIIIYNVPSRCGVSIDYQTIKKLLHLSDKLIGIKECSGDFNLIRLLKKNYPKFKVYYGNDKNFYKSLVAGADGIISVSSVLYAKDYIQLIKDYEDGFKNELLVEYLNLIGDLIAFETNPIPIKYLLSKHGFSSMNLRLPLVKLTLEGEKALDIL
ncbi:MAG: 4-hydroxy-tetrahydrodipicolinate synthase [Erysipelotrichales bacterium]|nr:4-hydroxy-tetrahydrodipicolinate synthase [Erysipelotrichales bacterium]